MQTLDAFIEDIARLVVEGLPPPALPACPIDRDEEFAVCYCGRLHRALIDACEVCGYETPALRTKRTDDELAEWRRLARRQAERRRRQAWGRAQQRRRRTSRT